MKKKDKLEKNKGCRKAAADDVEDTPINIEEYSTISSYKKQTVRFKLCFMPLFIAKIWVQSRQFQQGIEIASTAVKFFQ